MSTIRWTEEETKALIELYKAHPFLWDSSHKFYRKGQFRNYAYQKILATLKKPKLTVRDVRCKIKNLRSAYYTELKKLSYAEAHGQLHIPGLTWFDEFHDIMEIIQSNRMQTATETVDHGDDEEDREEEISDGEGTIDIVESAKLIPKSDTLVVSIKQEFLDKMEKKDIRFCPSVSDYLYPIESIETSEVTTKKRKAIKTNKRGTKQTDLDEFQLFANNMAMQLRNMPLDKALNLQVEIQALIAKERIDSIANDEAENEDNNE